jgi:hypothetical protein
MRDDEEIDEGLMTGPTAGGSVGVGTADDGGVGVRQGVGGGIVLGGPDVTLPIPSCDGVGVRIGVAGVGIAA